MNIQMNQLHGIDIHDTWHDRMYVHCTLIVI
jgi:hypothetical protein